MEDCEQMEDCKQISENSFDENDLKHEETSMSPVIDEGNESNLRKSPEIIRFISSDALSHQCKLILRELPGTWYDEELKLFSFTTEFPYEIDPDAKERDIIEMCMEISSVHNKDNEILQDQISVCANLETNIEMKKQIAIEEQHTVSLTISSFEEMISIQTEILKSYQAELQEYDEKNTQLNNEINSLPLNHDKMSELRKQISELKISKEAFKTNIDIIENQITSIEKSHCDLNNLVDKTDLVIKKFSAYSEDLQIYREFLSTIQCINDKSFESYPQGLFEKLHDHEKK